MNDITTTTEPLKAGNFNRTEPEFGSCNDVRRQFGIKRGTLYNLLADGKIKGVLLRVRGQKSGVRLISILSVREFIRSEMANSNPSNN